MLLPWFWISWPWSYLLLYFYGVYSFTSSLAVESQNDIIECSYFFFLSSTVNPEICKVFFQNKFIKFLGWSLGTLSVYDSSPRLFTVPFFLILSLMVSFWWICRYGGYDGKPASYILLSQRPDPKAKQVINLDQDVQVCGYFWWMMEETPLYDFSLPCIFLVWAIFSPFFWHALGACGLPSLGTYLFSFLFFFDMPWGHVAYLLWVCMFYFFLYSPYILVITLERDSHGTTWSFICGWMDVLAIFQV